MITSEPPEKKQKIRSDQCEFYLEKKKRNCRMDKHKNGKYCANHAPNDLHLNNKDSKIDHRGERIPCPKDPSHTVWSHQVERHLLKCNATQERTHDPWYVLDINCHLNHGSSSTLKTTNLDIPTRIDTDKVTTKRTIELSEEELYAKYIPIVQELEFPPLVLSQKDHHSLHTRLAQVEHKKHAIQQSSMIGNLKELGLLALDHAYIEFGCGRAELSRFVNTSIMSDYEFETERTNQKQNQTNAPSPPPPPPHSYSFGFIDRGKNRMKMDTKIIKDVDERHFPFKPTIQRSRIDIKDLDLTHFAQNLPEKDIVCLSKHLCGAATDLTLMLLLNSDLVSTGRFAGLVVAMCCRHVCDYDLLLPQSKKYLDSKGFSDFELFNSLKKMASWAVCGRKDGATDEEGTEHISGLLFAEREAVGQVARRLIDESRLHALREILPDTYEASIRWYVPREITLENVFLTIRRREGDEER